MTRETEAERVARQSEYKFHNGDNRELAVQGINIRRLGSSPKTGRNHSAPGIRMWNGMAYANNKALAELCGIHQSTITKRAQKAGLLSATIKFPFAGGMGNNYYALTPEFLEKMNIDPALVTNWRRENDPKFREPSNV